jgi:hypothetical protein
MDAPVEVNRENCSEGVAYVSTGIGDISAGLGGARAAGTVSGGCYFKEV